MNSGRRRVPIPLSMLMVPDPARTEAHALLAWAARNLDTSGGAFLRAERQMTERQWQTVAHTAYVQGAGSGT